MYESDSLVIIPTYNEKENMENTNSLKGSSLLSALASRVWVQLT